MSRGTVNQVTLIGNVGQDPEPRSTPNGTQIVNLNLATDDSYKDRQTGQMVPQTDWHRVVLIGKVAEVAGQYVRKGQKLYVQGKLKTRKYQKDGIERFTTEIVVDMQGTMEMLGDSSGQARQSQAEPKQQARQPQQQSQPTSADNGAPPDDDFPF
ncbi:single-stranded DNA-binding protein [Marinobacter salicampi]|uniref:single-stranded DNA-binding protein n=1 Tax=Marinobacter salicampi TaxID=435907 RepID=UPI00140CA11A|nr:single-stranded DNA-binding protein [Marinobacter salicampi]